ncbi:hypothetical protein [Streptomyces sp. B93]|uniref:hypothetical protein n=1 Tax=Streptomyces sp. B93 TaxID=2824875 RepID=UPI001B399E57|nr:hypothetical protein [Streptomyces sp. B93]MBQ1088568.1 hypothetical protein [Streptomyces sp. B93]
MAGTDEDAVAAEDDALYVLTAVLLTPAQFPSVLGDDYPEACAALGLAPLVDGYGLVLGQDGDGARWTVVTDDVSLVAVAIAAWDCGMEYDLSPDERSVVAALPGWPLAVAVAAPGVPAPHDPAPEIAGGPALSPPDTDIWGPAQRRLGADEIALQWAMWREQIDDSEFATASGAAGSDAGAGGPAGGGDTGGEEAIGTGHAAPGPGSGGSVPDNSAPVAEGSAADGSAPLSGGSALVPGGSVPATDRPAPDSDRSDSGVDAPPSGNHSDATADVSPPGDAPASDTDGDRPTGVRRVLAEARAYVDTPPPLGRVRSSFAPGDARTLRADGPGWSLVARTDDIAFVLLDDMPGEVLPVGRGPELPGLLAALDQMAVRPS